jgi:DNA-binding NarL/FixJ family response regulator
MDIIKVGIAEDHLKFRKAFLRSTKEEPDLDFVIEAENGADLIMQLESVIPDVILIGIRMPVMDGFEAATTIHKRYPQIKIIAFTQFYIEYNIIEMSRIGIKSFVDKGESSEVLKAIRTVVNGGVYYSDKIARVITNYFNRVSALHIECPVKLTGTEITILQCICKGFSSTQIGDLICKSPRTVEKYRNELYQKFNVANKEQLIVEISKWDLFR